MIRDKQRDCSTLTLSLVISVLLLNFLPFLLFHPKLNCGPREVLAVIDTRVPLLDSKTKPCSVSLRMVTCCRCRVCVCTSNMKQVNTVQISLFT